MDRYLPTVLEQAMKVPEVWMIVNCGGLYEEIKWYDTEKENSNRLTRSTSRKGKCKNKAQKVLFQNLLIQEILGNKRF